jgi:hypothetical protein
MEQSRDQPVFALQVGEHCPCLVRGEHDGQPFRRFGSHHVINPRRFDLQHLLYGNRNADSACD